LTFKPLDKKRYPELVAHEIEKRILNNELQLGQKLLPEMQLAKDFQVSRSVVREAMRLLEGGGFVTIKRGPKGGIFANNGYHKPLSEALGRLVDSGMVHEEHVFEIRLLIEPYAAGEAARWATKNDIGKLRDLLARSRERMDDPDFLQQVRGKFHICLAEASGNPILLILMNALIELLRKYFSEFKELDLEKQAVGIHEKILDAIVERKPEKASKLMKMHIMEIKKYVEKWGKAG
jgi:GntR family transcriptional regulator, transcriptional repressor for pyruvate dehydrogenase complex